MEGKGIEINVYADSGTVTLFVGEEGLRWRNLMLPQQEPQALALLPARRRRKRRSARRKNLNAKP